MSNPLRELRNFKCLEIDPQHVAIYPGVVRAFIGAVEDEKADGLLVRLIAQRMADKLVAARKKGRGGWFEPHDCSNAVLAEMFVEHLDKGDKIDCINLLGMMVVREMLYGKDA